MPFTNRTIFITGASRGIGRAIALRLAKEGANIIIAAKSVEEDPRLGGTIYSVAKEIEDAGGKALPIQVDIRNEEQIESAVQQAADEFGGIDALINNASAIQIGKTEQTETRRFDLMQSINVRGTFLVTKHCIPWLKKGNNPHILTLSPPVNLDLKWLSNHVAYTMSKYNMSMMALAWAGELKKYNIASNALWPRTTIDTAAIRNILGGEELAKMSRTTDIVADAVYCILSKEHLSFTGNTAIDEEVLKAAGITDFEHYSVVPGAQLYTDLFL